jgi:hypothetical protein
MSIKWWLIFVAIQVGQIPLMVVGVPVCLALSFAHAWHPVRCDRQWSAVYGQTIFVWPRWAWVWSNDEDGVLARWYVNAYPNRPLWWLAFVWSALRNSCHNYCLIPGIFGEGRPIWVRNWIWRGTKYYIKAGWVSAGWPVLSAGKGAW